MLERYNKTIAFYGYSLLIPWILWFAVAYLSHRPYQSNLLQLAQQTLAIMGLFAPTVVAAYYFMKDEVLKKDLLERLFKLEKVEKKYILMTVFLLPISIILAQFISLLFGHNLGQFYISGKPTFTSFLLSPWLILILAPIVEELAWHSYGTDTLRRKFNLFNTCLIFAFYWVFWHFPLSFVKGYFHSNVVAEGWIYSLNYIFSLFVFVVLMNWLYFKTKRNIVVTIIFHLMANISNEIFATHPDSKVIQTGLLLIVAITVLYIDREMFFGKTQGGDDGN